jgi:prevent-host-death family protein
MQTTTASQFRESPGAYLQRAEPGEDVLITDDGHPIARLIPFTDEETLSRRIKEMEDAGLIKSGKGTLPADFWDLPRPADPDGVILKSVLREREESW